MKPILFSTDMVRAILALIKTKTRRTKGLEKINKTPERFRYYGYEYMSHFFAEIDKDGNDTGNLEKVKCPYGDVDDVLWVREKFRRLVNCETGEFHSFNFYADMPEKFHQQFPHKWKPSIHMPFKACRLFLKIKSIKAERLQSISEKDAIAEGVSYGEQVPKAVAGMTCTMIIDARSEFASLWEKINGEGSYELNPWVWVIKFEITEKPK